MGTRALESATLSRFRSGELPVHCARSPVSGAHSAVADGLIERLAGVEHRRDSTKSRKITRSVIICPSRRGSGGISGDLTRSPST
ncbi:hypothetical protein LSAT2_004517 [Lamellibrachia satsuma]|nr:hypothetical protein LSAT2_004517 [Lamellibrachia satsuma]